MTTVLVLAGCASTPNIRTDYSTPITGHFKRAVSGELEARGYRLGLYTAWPLHSGDVSTSHYQVGTAIDKAVADIFGMYPVSAAH